MSKYAYILVTIVAILFLTGSLMVYNTTSAEIIDKALEIELNAAFLKQLTYAFIGVVFAFLINYYGIEKLQKSSFFILFFLCLMLISVFIPGIGMQLNGAKRWIRILGVSIQPSEFVKIFLPMVVIRHYVLNPVRSIYDFIKLLGIAIPPVFLILIEPDNGTFVIIMITLFVLFLLFEINKKYWMLPCLFVLLFAGVLASRMPHVMNRIQIYIHPEQDILGKGHQPYQAKIAVGSGGVLGRGMGQSLQKLTYLPEARSDYIAAIFAEEFGFVGILILIGAYLLFALVGVKIAFNSRSISTFYLAIALVFLVNIQVFLNLGVVSGLLPSKGTNLPFFSQGGSSLVANFMIVGILVSIANTKEAKIHEK